MVKLRKRAPKGALVVEAFSKYEALCGGLLEQQREVPAGAWVDLGIGWDAMERQIDHPARRAREQPPEHHCEWMVQPDERVGASPDDVAHLGVVSVGDPARSDQNADKCH